MKEIPNVSDQKKETPLEIEPYLTDYLVNYFKKLKEIPEDRVYFGPTFLIDSVLGKLKVFSVVTYGEGMSVGQGAMQQEEWDPVQKPGRMIPTAEHIIFCRR